jgi:hypothetical protein
MYNNIKIIIKGNDKSILYVAEIYLLSLYYYIFTLLQSTVIVYNINFITSELHLKI